MNAGSTGCLRKVRRFRQWKLRTAFNSDADSVRIVSSVIYSMPAYVTKIRCNLPCTGREDYYLRTVVQFLQDSGVDSIANTVTMYGKAMTNGSDLSNGIIDVLNKLSSVDLSTVAPALRFDKSYL